VDDDGLKEQEDKINQLLFEIGDIMSKFKAKMDSLEQANIELYKAVDQMDAELGFWDTIPKKNTGKK
jgi:hypothetical protein